MQGKPTYTQEECFRFRDRLAFVEAAWIDERRDHFKTMEQRSSAFLNAKVAEDKADAAIRSLSQCAARLATYEAALRGIIERSHNGELGTSKVNDMREIARKALEDNT